MKEILVSIIDDDMSEPDVTFSVVLSDVKGVGVYLIQVWPRWCSNVCVSPTYPHV